MFFGSIPALATPFSENCVDEDSLRSLVEWQVEQGSDALVPCGTTGESATMTAAEQKRVIEIAVEVSGGRAPVIAGCGSNSVAVAIEHLHAAADIVALSPVVPHGTSASEPCSSCHSTRPRSESSSTQFREKGVTSAGMEPKNMAFSFTWESGGG